ncbi:MAG: hypothetical protein KQI35_04510 [Bacteroidetes bacterium]|nr:hypothetical protein [Bacteroidota bacterium]
MKSPVFIVTGESGSGKTTTLFKLYNALLSEKIEVAGILAPGTWKDNQRDLFELVNLLTGDRIVYCQRDPVDSWEPINHFYINPEGQSFGEKTLHWKHIQNAKVIFIDEIGPFEMQGKGWAPSLEAILLNLDVPLVISVRKSLINEVIGYWNLNVQGIIDASKNHLSLLEKMMKFLKS